MKKIGVLSFQQAVNYGATLQIYALQKVLKKLSVNENEVEVINYIQPILESNYKINNKIDKMSDLVRNIIYFPSRFIKKRRFKKFIKKRMLLTKPFNKLSELNNFSTIVVGSDQVWNSNIHDFDTTYLLDGVGDVKKISYAASIGKISLNDKEKNYFEKYLPNFSAISVRENSAVSLIRKYTDLDISVDLDPTLLLNASEWRQLYKERKNKRKYILVYHVGPDQEKVDRIAEKVSAEMGLPLKYIISKGDTLLDRASLKYTSGPEDFLRLIDNSEIVVTNSFHGTCFSIIFNKTFFTVPHAVTGSRVKDLLNNLNLNDRIIYDNSELRNTHYVHKDFSEANDLLNKLKDKSIKYLSENI